MSVLINQQARALAETLHKTSEAEVPGMAAYFSERGADSGLLSGSFDTDSHQFMADKMVALEQDKAEFCHMLVRATRATRVVEIGTSHGVSTLYLADAVNANGGGTVIATEYEANKADIARDHFAQTGLDSLIDLREGDLRKTLVGLDLDIDFVLMDIWVEMARPAIELLYPNLNPGAIVICDNTETYREAYREYFEFIEDPANRMTTRTLPFRGGLEFSMLS